MVKVRVRNFQSIKDAKIKIDGLTVVTGANNSGKTALMRAIRGVFENSPSSSLLRKGADRIIVNIEFEDDQTVTWYKGPKDNSYKINGYKIAGVGRGAPEELKDFGVFPIVAANNLVWPQLASQFDGTIFLLNRSGAVLAEALSDVEKVGKLTSALRLSEKDRRSIGSELKVRRKDLKAQEETVSKFEGFEEFEREVKTLAEEKKRLLKKAAHLELVRGLRKKFKSCKDSLKAFEGFDQNINPSKEKLIRLEKATLFVRRISERYNRIRKVLQRYKGFEDIVLPSENIVTKRKEKLKEVQALRNSMYQTQKKLSSLSKFSIPALPSETLTQKYKQEYENAEALFQRYNKAYSGAQEFIAQEKNLTQKQDKVLKLVSELLGNLGECPVCKTPHGGSC